MRSRQYGRFCGLARAVEVLGQQFGQQWTLLILRDLLVAPLRYSIWLPGCLASRPICSPRASRNSSRTA